MPRAQALVKGPRRLACVLRGARNPALSVGFDGLRQFRDKASYCYGVHPIVADPCPEILLGEVTETLNQ